VTETILYDSIGIGYAQRQQADPRIFAAVRSALGDARRSSTSERGQDHTSRPT
jgi:hypothetical protein